MKQSLCLGAWWPEGRSSSSVSQSLPSCSWSACQMAVNGKDGYRGDLSLWCFSSSAFTAFEVDDLQRGESRPWVGSSLLALNGGGRFLSPSSPLSSLLCSLVSWETLSALLSKLKYYGLTGLLMQLTLSKLKNSENGNSCPKPHKAARMIEAVGRAVSIETEL